MAAFKKSSRMASAFGTGGDRPPFEGIYIYLFSLLIGYVLADLGLLYSRPLLLPTKPPPQFIPPQRGQAFQQESGYDPIKSRNLFNADGVIPPALTSAPEAQLAGGEEAPAVPSQLPLKLEGTIVHANPQRSVATITIQAKNEAQAFMLEDEIPGLAKITKIERRRVTFRNLQTSRMEYIEIPKESAITFGLKSSERIEGDGEVSREGDFDFSVRREDLNKYTSDLASVLNQAAMVPNIIPGSGGKVEGFRFVRIQPNSIYEKLGFKVGDVIKGVNDEPVNSPTKAMELYNSLRTDARIKLQVERDGRDETFNYSVKD